MAEHVVSIDRVINASANELYAALTEAPILARWLAPTLEADVRVGGAIRLPDEGGSGVIRGTYEVLQQGHLIEVTFATEVPGDRTNQRLAVRLHPHGALTRLELAVSWDGAAGDVPALARAVHARLDRLCAGVELTATADLDR